MEVYSPPIDLGKKPATPEQEETDNFECSSIHNASKNSLLDEDRDISLLREIDNDNEDSGVNSTRNKKNEDKSANDCDNILLNVKVR
jgi:hypothetical protein